MKKVAVVTGAARGIGLATVRYFLAEGWRVAMLDVDTDMQARARTLDNPSEAIAMTCGIQSGADARPRMGLWSDMAALMP